MSGYLDLKMEGLDIAITSDDWYTPKWLFEALACEFDIDVCAPYEGVAWLPAKKHYSLVDDGLSQDWQGFIWMNPPYSDPLPWVRKFIENGQGIALVPTSTGKWMIELWEAATTWIILPPMRFQAPDGQIAKGALPVMCWLVGLGDKANAILQASKLGLVK